MKQDEQDTWSAGRAHRVYRGSANGTQSTATPVTQARNSLNSSSEHLWDIYFSTCFLYINLNNSLWLLSFMADEEAEALERFKLAGLVHKS